MPVGTTIGRPHIRVITFQFLYCNVDFPTIYIIFFIVGAPTTDEQCSSIQTFYSRLRIPEAIRNHTGILKHLRIPEAGSKSYVADEQCSSLQTWRSVCVYHKRRRKPRTDIMKSSAHTRSNTKPPSPQHAHKQTKQFKQSQSKEESICNKLTDRF